MSRRWDGSIISMSQKALLCSFHSFPGKWDQFFIFSLLLLRGAEDGTECVWLYIPLFPVYILAIFYVFVLFVLRNFVSGKISQFFFADLGQSSGCVRVGVALRMTQWNIIKYVACPQRGRDTFAYTTMASGETGAYVDILLIFEHKFYLPENDDEIEK